MPANIIVFGDSIAYGQSDYENSGWVNRLKMELNRINKKSSLNFFQEHSVYNCSVPGDTTDSLMLRMENDYTARKNMDINIVIIALGANDCRVANGEELVTLERYVDNMKKVIKFFAGIKSEKKTRHSLRSGHIPEIAKIYFINITPVVEQDINSLVGAECCSNKRVDEYNQTLKDLCKDSEPCYIDVNSVFIEREYSKLFQDGLHPNAAGHDLIEQAVMSRLNADKLI